MKDVKDTKIQWHPGFVAAMNLENRDSLTFESEHNLNKGPLEIDLLIIKKDAGVEIANEIGRIFRGHNITEYKSPEDSMDIDTLCKVYAYAFLYKEHEESLNAIDINDIMVSVIRDAKPVGLFKYLKVQGYSVSNPYNGTYYIEGIATFKTQIVVTKELKPGTHIWLKSLSFDMCEQDMKELLSNTERLKERQDRELAFSVLDVSANANSLIISKIIGDDDMSQALLELMAPIIKPQMDIVRDEGEKQGRKEGRKEGSIEILRELGYKDEEIKSIIQRKYNLSEEELNKYFY